jgi:PAT family beta-lactamase induction signal transducer AmpG
MKERINPWFYVPTTYFAEGLPYVLVNSLVVVLYKKMNVSNDVIAFLTSWLFLPWTIKFLWGGVVDTVSTKRKWIIYTQFFMSISILLASFFLNSPNFLIITLSLFMLVAFLSATHDIAVDGFYMISLDEKDQAFFIGIRAFFYRLAMLFSSSVLLIYAGKLEEKTGNIVWSWRVTLLIIAFILGLLFLYHTLILPFPKNDFSKKFNLNELKEAFLSYFKIEKIWIAVAFIILYRFGEAMLLKITPLFMLDGIDKGGLGISTADYGKIYGTFGLISLIVGNILGGMIISKWGLRKCIWPMALFLNVPDLVYVYMSYHNTLPISYVYFLVSLEQFGYGLGTTAFMYYLVQLTDEKYKTTHFAISTSIMAMGLMLPGMISGKLQVMLGYPLFFIVVCIATIPGMLLIPFLKYK